LLHGEAGARGRSVSLSGTAVHLVGHHLHPPSGTCALIREYGGSRGRSADEVRPAAASYGAARWALGERRVGAARRSIAEHWPTLPFLGGPDLSDVALAKSEGPPLRQ